MQSTILVVDDDAAYRQLLTWGLEQAGFHVVGARNGADAVPLIEERPPHAMLVDMLMPVMDGLELLRWVRDESGVEIPTILLTSLESRAHAVEALMAGAADVVLKPVGLQTLLDKLDTLLGDDVESGSAHGEPAAEPERQAELQPGS